MLQKQLTTDRLKLKIKRTLFIGACITILDGCTVTQFKSTEATMEPNAPNSAIDIRQTAQDARGTAWEIKRAADEVKRLMDGL